MTTIHRSPQLPDGVFITSVHCAICHRFAKTGEYTIAPASSIHAGKPVCATCIDLAPSVPTKRIGPSERKVVEPNEKKRIKTATVIPYETTAGKWKLEY